MTDAAESQETYRLITRADLDGLVCAALFKQLGMVNEIKFAHPKDMQDGLVEVTDKDITANLPYVEGCHLCFDHHDSEKYRLDGSKVENYIIDPSAPSAARVVYDHYGGAEKFPGVAKELMDAVDKADSAQFTKDDILAPEGWELLSFIMDARTGLGRFQDFKINNYELMLLLADEISTGTPVNDILAKPDVKERVDLYKEHEEKFKEQLKECSELDDTLVILDLREQEEIYSGNRFMIYALYPEATVSMHIMWGKDKANTVFAVGKSILDRSSAVNIGALMLDFGGGGHQGAGTCQVENDQAEMVKDKLVERILSQS